jgi:hypothetical protein
MQQNHVFSISGKKWPWKYTKLKGSAIGWTFMKDPKNPNVQEKVLIDSSLSGKRRLEVEVHEFLHAANPTQSEEHVSQQGSDLARILWALGYRLKEES